MLAEQLKYQPSVTLASRGAFCLALSGAACLPAQTPGAPYAPLTVGQKYAYSFNKVFGFPGLLGATLHAGIDQADHQPDLWGQGYDAFGARVASRFGRSLVRQSIAGSIGALDHEDPRYFVSGQGGVWKRTRYAIAHAFVVRNDNGTSMPAYSQFIADYAMPFIAQRWRPTQYRTMSEGFTAGSLSLGIAAGVNIGREFWPDIRKKILSTRLGSRYATMAAGHGH